MKPFISIFILFACNFSFASNKQSYMTIDEIRISDTDECKTKKCIAYDVAIKKIKIPQIKHWTPGGANPTSEICKSLDAQPKIEISENKDEISICYFKDGSYIFAWDLIKILKKSNPLPP